MTKAKPIDLDPADLPSDPPNDDELAQAGTSGDASTAPVQSGEYQSTDGDVQGQTRDTGTLKNERVIDPAAPFDYAELPDNQDVQGNHYPPGPDYYKAVKAQAERDAGVAQAALDAANATLDQATKDHDANVPSTQVN